MATGGPLERDVKDFAFKLAVKIRVDSPSSDSWPGRNSLVAVSNKYDLIFIGFQNGFQVIRVTDIDTKAETVRKAVETVDDFAFYSTVRLQGRPKHLAVNSDSSILSVCVSENQVNVAHLYDVQSFSNASKQGTITPFQSIKLGQGEEIVDLSWNPGLEFASMCAVCFMDGSLQLLNVNNTSIEQVATLPAATMATCMCWSPKGKQIVVGKANGTFSQYDQKLAEKKSIPAATGLFGGGNMPVSVLDIFWESTQVFFVVYKPSSGDNSEQPWLVIVSLSRDATPTFSVMEDVCFGGDASVYQKYYMSSIPDWRMVLCCSSTSQETVIVGCQNGGAWERWNLDDNSRAEIPMTSDYVEMFPRGMSVSFNSQRKIPLNETQTHPASPVLLLLSMEGLLVCYYMMYTNTDVPQLARPIEVLTGQCTRTASGAAGVSGQPGSQLSGQLTSRSTPPPAYGAASQSSAVAPAQPSAQSEFPFQPQVKFSGFQAQSKAGQQAQIQTGPQSSLGLQPQTRPQSTPVVQPQGGPQPNSEIQPQAGPRPTPGMQLKTGPQSVSGAQPQSGLPPATGIFSQGGAQSQAGLQPQTGFVASAATQGQIKPQQPRPVSQSSSGSLEPQPAAAFQSTPFSMTAKSTTTSTPAKQNSRTAPGLFGPSAGGGGEGAQVGNNSLLTSFNFGQPINQSTPAHAITKEGQPSHFGSGLTSQPSGSAEASSSGSRPVAAQQRTAKPVVTTADPVAGTQPSVAAGGAETAGALKLRSKRRSGDTAENVYKHSIDEEVAHFERELAELRSRVIVSNVGTQAEKDALPRHTEHLKTFYADVKADVKALNQQISSLKTNCIDLFAMMALCEQLQASDGNPAVKDLLRSRPLDPVREREMKTVRSLNMYIRNEIGKADALLDEQWQNYQQQKNSQKVMKAPASDVIYRTISDNMKTIEDQRRSVEYMRNDLHSLRLFNTSSSWQTSAQHAAVDESLCKEFSKTLHVNGSSPLPKKAISADKEAQIRDALIGRKVTPVKSTAPKNLSASKIVSIKDLKELLTPRPPESEDVAKTVPLPADASYRSASRSGLPSGGTGIKTVSSTSRGIPNAQVNNFSSASSPALFGTLGGAKFAPNVEAPVPAGAIASTGMLTSLVNPAQDAEAKSFFTKLLPGGVGVRTGDDGSKPAAAKMGQGTIFGGSDTASAGKLGHGTVLGGPEGGTSFPKFGVSTPSHTVQHRPTAAQQSVKPSPGNTDIRRDAQLAAALARQQQLAQMSNKSAAQNLSTFTHSHSAQSVQSDSHDEETYGDEEREEEDDGNESDEEDEDEDEEETDTEDADNTLHNAGRPGFHGTSADVQSKSLFGAASVGFSASTSGVSAPPSSKPAFASQSAASSGQLPGFGQSAALFGVQGKPFSTAKDAERSNLGAASDATSGKGRVASSAVSSEASAAIKPENVASAGPDLVSTTKMQSAFHTGTPLKLFGKMSGTGDQSSSVQSETKSAGPPSSSSTTSLFGKSGQSLFGKPIASPLDLAEQPSSSAPVSVTSSATTSSAVVTPETAVTASLAVTASTVTTSVPGLFGQLPLSTTAPINSTAVPQGHSSASSAPVSGKTDVTISAGSDPVFGQTATTSGGSISAFGQAAASSSGSSLFGQAHSATTTPSPSGQASSTTAATTTGAPSLVGQAASVTTTSSTGAPSPFGQPPSTTTVSSSGAPSIFAQPPSTTVATSAGAPSPFGQPVATSGNGSAVFGQTNTTSSASLFGQPPTTSATGFGSTFGQPAAVSSADDGAVFGQAGPASSGTSAPGFGQPSVFGQQAASTSASGTSLFGKPATTSASSTSAFGQPAAGGTPASGASLFGSASVFGQQTNGSAPSVFGQSSATTTSAVFGQQASSTATANLKPFGFTGSGGGFGQPSAFAQPAFGQPAFGQTSAPSGSADSGSMFGGSGGLFGGLGGQPSAEKANINVFGSVSPFGSSQSQPSTGVFGQSPGSSTFATVKTQANITGAFSGGGGGVGSTGFGFQKPSATQPGQFGAAPAFGSPPAFGGAPAFGSAPVFGSPTHAGSAFGGGAAFSSPFGGGTTGGGFGGGGAGLFGGGSFGSGDTGSNTFAALAQQTNVPTFGVLAQQGGAFSSPQQQQQQPSFGFGAAQQPSFGGGSFAPQPPTSPSFTSYRS